MQRSTTCRVHWDSLPLFPAELLQYDNRQGIFDFLGDGQGTWVFGIVPGAVYNEMCNQALAGSPVVGAIMLRSVPDLFALNLDGSLNYQWLRASGFEYRPQDVAVAGAQVSQSIFGFITKAVRAVASVAEGVVSLVRQGIGKIDQWLAGSAVVTMTFQINNTDPAFNTGNPATNVMQQAWGANFGQGIKLPGGVDVKLRQTVLGISSLATHVGSTDANGGAVIHVAKNGTTNACVTLKSGAAALRSFLTPIEICGFATHIVRASETIKVVIEHPYMNLFAQMNDARNYFGTVGGTSIGRVEVLVGPFADLMTINGRSFTPCFTHFNAFSGALLSTTTSLLTPVITAGASGILGVLLGPLASGVAAGIGATMLPIVEASDMIIANADQKSRLVPTHEYGHAAMCDLLDQTGRFSSIYGDIVIDTVGAGGKPSIANENLYINEGWADFVASQVAGGVNYFGLSAREGNKAGGNFYCRASSRRCMDDNIGGPHYCPGDQGPGSATVGGSAVYGCQFAIDSEVGYGAASTKQQDFNARVGFITTWLTDMVDHQKYSGPTNDPGNGAAWELVGQTLVMPLQSNSYPYLTGYDSGYTSTGDNPNNRDDEVSIPGFNAFKPIWVNFNRPDPLNPQSGKYVYGSLNEVNFISNLIGTVDVDLSTTPGEGCRICRLHDPSGECPAKYAPFVSCAAVPPPPPGPF